MGKQGENVDFAIGRQIEGDATMPAQDAAAHRAARQSPGGLPAARFVEIASLVSQLAAKSCAGWKHQQGGSKRERKRGVPSADAVVDPCP